MRIFLFSGIFSLLALMTPVSVQAQVANPQPGATETVAENHGPYFFADGTVTLQEETYAGSVFVAGGEVTVLGDIQGDLVVAGGTIRVLGNVEQDVYAAGGTITIAGQVLGNVVAVGGEVNLTDTAQVGDSTIIGGENVFLAGTIFNKAFTGGSQVTFAGEVMSDVQVAAEKLVLAPTAFIGGNVIGQIGEQPAIASSSQVEGSTSLTEIQEDEWKDESSAIEKLMGRMVFTVWMFMSQTLFAFLLLWIWPNFLQQKALRISNDWLSTLLKGITVVVLSPVLMILLAATVLFLPLAGMLFLLYASMIFLAGFLVFLPLGRKMYAAGSDQLQIVIGSLAMILVGQIPIIGWILCLVAVTLGVGALLPAKQK